MDEKGVNRTSVVGPYSEAESLRLMCDVFGGKTYYASSDLYIKLIIFIFYKFSGLFSSVNRLLSTIEYSKKNALLKTIPHKLCTIDHLETIY